MVEHPFPQRTAAQATSEIGAGIVAAVVRQTLGWEFRRTPQESDFGVDGYLDIVTPDGYVTGKSLAVQIKTGPSYFEGRTPEGWRYRGELKHVNYYLNIGCPVLILIVHPSLRKVWWRLFEAYETDRTGSTWTIVVPYSNQLTSETRVLWERIAGPSIDYLPHLEHFWVIGEKVKENDLVCVLVQRFEIESCNVRPFAKIFERLSRSREVVESAVNKVDFLIDGYDGDARELYQISEVRSWIESAINAVKYLSYFLYLGDQAQGIRTIVGCLCGAERVDRSRGQAPPDRHYIRFRDPDRILDFVNQQFAWLNEFTEKHRLSEETNRSVSLRFSEKVGSLME